MKEGMGGGKEHEAPTHLINLPMLHALPKIIAEVLRRLTASLLVCSRSQTHVSTNENENEQASLKKATKFGLFQGIKFLLSSQ